MKGDGWVDKCQHKKKVNGEAFWFIAQGKEQHVWHEVILDAYTFGVW